MNRAYRYRKGKVIIVKVCVIPGHGGFDPGACNADGTRECDGNLAVGLKLKELLELNGIEVVMSRTTDVACWGAIATNGDVNNQIYFGNNSGADIAVAIHFNSSTNDAAHGVEALYSQYNGLTIENVKLSNLLLEEIVSATGLNSRGIKDTAKSIGVVRGINIPVSLTECAFVSNPGEVIWCSDPAHHVILARAHAKAICRYFGIEYKEEIEVPEWMQKIMDRSVAAGLIESGKHNPNDAPAKWFILAIALKVLQIMGRDV